VSQIYPTGPGTPPGGPPPGAPPPPNDEGDRPPRRVQIADATAEAALAVMLGIGNGSLPLKHARAMTDAGELAIRSIVVAEEYQCRRPLALPGLPASGEVFDERPGAARKP